MNRFTITDLRSESSVTPSPRLISIMSGKGGVGKSVVSLAIAEQLATSAHRVLVVDVDPGCGNQHILANVNYEHGISEVIDGALKIEQAITAITPKIDLLAASHLKSSHGELDIASSTTLARALREQTNRYGFVVLDHASGVSRAQLNLACHSDEIVIVILPELTSISDGYSLHKRIVESGSSVRVNLTVNRIDSEIEAHYIRDKFNALSDQFVGSVPRWIGSIPEDESVRKTVARQKLLSQLAPESAAIQAFSSLASLIANESFSSPITNPETTNKNRLTADIEG